MTNTEWKGRALAIITVLLLSMSALVIVPDPASAATAPTWTTAPSLSLNRTGSAYAQVGDSIYIMGGGNTSFEIDNLTFSYNMITGESRSLAPMLTGQRGATAAATDDGRIFVFGGTSASAVTQIYYISNDTWIAGPNLPFGAWQAKAAFDRDTNVIYVVGGEGGISYMTNQQVLSLSTMTWSAGTPLPAGVKTGNLAYMDGYLLYIGGINTTGATNATLSYYSGAWHVAKPMPAKLTYAAAAIGIDGQIYIIGGSNLYALGSNALKGVYAYEPHSDTWKVVATLPLGRETPVAGATSDGRIVCAGGTNLTVTVKNAFTLRIATMTATSGPTPTEMTGQPMSVTVTIELAYRSLDYFHSEVFLRDSAGTTYGLGSIGSVGGYAMMGFTLPQYAAAGGARLDIPNLNVHDTDGFAWDMPLITTYFTIAAAPTLQAQIDLLNVSVGTLQTQLQGQQSLLANMTANSSVQASQIAALRTSIAAAQANLSSLQSMLTSAQTQLTALQTQTSSEINATSSRQNLSQTQIAALQAQIDLLNAQLNSSQLQLAQIRTDTRAVQSSVDQKMDSTTGMLTLILMLAAIAALAVAMVMMIRRK
jgi:N-acetylneuraminic acid mutarotase